MQAGADGRVPTPEDVVVRAWRAGRSEAEIAAATGLTLPLVRRILGEGGLIEPPRGRPWPYDATTERHLALAYVAGATMSDIVRRFGGNNRAIRVVLDHRGVPVRPAGRQRKAG